MATYEVSLLVKVAEMYYYRKMSQKDIGKMLNLSPAKISRILQEALDTGVVKIEISEEAIEYTELNEKIKEKFKLEGVKVVNIPAKSDGWQLKKILGQATKQLFTDIVEPGYNVGMGAGETLGEMVSSLNVGEIPFNIKIVPLMGGWSSSNLNYETNNLVYNMASTLGCEYNALLAPAVLSNREIKDVLFSEPEIKIVDEMWDKMDMAIFSIGPKISQSVHKELYRSEAIGEAIGDLLGWAINSDGTLAELELHHRLVSIPLNRLKKIPKRIAVGGGINKCLNLNSVLKGGYVTHLVTDYNTALYILNNGG